MAHHAEGLFTPHLGADGIAVSPLRAFSAGGQTGVSLFFVLSGFCLSRPFFGPGGALAAHSFRIGTFFARRALRILPLYWTVLVAAALVKAGSPGDLLHALPWAVFLQSLPGWTQPLPPFTGVMWSLATEVQFYLLVPLLPLARRSLFRRRLGIAALLLYAAWFVAFLHGDVRSRAPENAEAFAQWLSDGWNLAQSLPGRGPIFLVGILAAWIHSLRDASARLRLPTALLRRGGGDALLGAVLVALALLLRWQVGYGYFLAEVSSAFAWHLAEGLLWGSVLVLLLTAPLIARPLFCNSMLERIGTWSYSLYLLHLPLLTGAVDGCTWLANSPCRGQWSTTTALLVAAWAGTCIALSSLTYRWIERPFLNRKTAFAASPGPGS